MKQIFSIICYVFAGWMLATSSMFCFMKTDELIPNVPPLFFFAATFGLVLLPGLLALLIGLRIAPNKNWQRDVGGTVCGGAGAGSLVAFNIFSMLRNPEVQKELPNLAETFGNYPAGLTYLSVLGLFGGVLLYRGLRKEKQNEQGLPQPETNPSRTTHPDAAAGTTGDASIQ